jgi:deferrochelatase/peroxidase EfeB
MARLAEGVAVVRWTQAGFIAERNPIGFKDGTRNLSAEEPDAMNRFVWVGDEGPEWMRGGSYVVFRRIWIALDRWDGMPSEFQEQTIGRRKSSGTPLGGVNEFDEPDLVRHGDDGDPVIPDSAHIRLAAAESNDGARMLRRSYGYDDGMSLIRERWPPWRRAVQRDSGLFFVCYQRDPRTGFIKIFERLSKNDMLNQFTMHTGGGLFACPGGVGRGEYIGQRLFEGA